MMLPDQTPVVRNESPLLPFLQRVRRVIEEHPGVFYPLFLFILVVGSAYYIHNLYFKPVRTVTVVGVGTKKVKPDKATVSFSLVYSAANQQEAITQGEQKFSALLNAVNSYKPDVEKTAYQVIQGTQNGVVGGYQYVNAAKITINDPTQMPAVVKSLYENGATVVSQARYIPKDQDKIDAEVRQLAIKDARERVGQMARASGSWVGKVVSIQEGGSTGQTGTSVMGTTSTTPSDVTAPVAGSGDIEIQAQVTVVYELL